jgi:hypothetical protein
MAVLSPPASSNTYPAHQSLAGQCKLECEACHREFVAVRKLLALPTAVPGFQIHPYALPLCESRSPRRLHFVVEYRTAHHLVGLLVNRVREHRAVAFVVRVRHNTLPSAAQPAELAAVVLKGEPGWPVAAVGSSPNQCLVATQTRHTESMTGTSTKTPTTVASAAPESAP